MLLPRYPPGGVFIPRNLNQKSAKAAKQLHLDSCHPHDGSLQRLADAFGDNDRQVIHMVSGSVVVIPPGIHHAALNLERCVSFNTTHVPLSALGTLAALDRTVVWFQSSEDVGRLMGAGFTEWVEEVITLFLDDLRGCVVGIGKPGYESFCTKMGTCVHLASIVQRMVNVGCKGSSRINKAWRDGMSSYIHTQINEMLL